MTTLNKKTRRQDLQSQKQLKGRPVRNLDPSDPTARGSTVAGNTTVKTKTVVVAGRKRTVVIPVKVPRLKSTVIAPIARTSTMLPKAKTKNEFADKLRDREDEYDNRTEDYDKNSILGGLSYSAANPHDITAEALQDNPFSKSTRVVDSPKDMSGTSEAEKLKNRPDDTPKLPPEILISKVEEEDDKAFKSAVALQHTAIFKALLSTSPIDLALPTAYADAVEAVKLITTSRDITISQGQIGKAVDMLAEITTFRKIAELLVPKMEDVERVVDRWWPANPVRQ